MSNSEIRDFRIGDRIEGVGIYDLMNLTRRLGSIIFIRELGLGSFSPFLIEFDETDEYFHDGYHDGFFGKRHCCWWVPLKNIKLISSYLKDLNSVSKCNILNQKLERHF